MKRAVIYIRESTKFQDPDTQEKECRAYCKENDFQIVKTYRDIASGKKNDRKGFLQMLDDLDEDRFDVLVLWELSRSTRDFITYKTLLDTLIQNNKELHSLQEGILTQDDIDVEFSNDIRALINAHERKRVGRRIKFRKNFKTREGYWTNGQAPFGYKLDNGVLIPDEEEASVVKEIFELCKQGKSTRTIATIMQNNIAYLKTSKWRSDRIYKILTNFIYIGVFEYDKYKRKPQIILRIKDYCEQIIDEITWNATKNVLVKNKYPNYGEHIHLFSELVKHPICGEIMASSGSFKYPNGRLKVYYHLRCKTHHCSCIGLHYNTEK